MYRPLGNLTRRARWRWSCEHRQRLTWVEPANRPGFGRCEERAAGSDIMLPHPILNALFNEKAVVPSNQLQNARSQLYSARLEPHIVIILPPIALLTQYVDSETFYHDSYLLSHVALVDWEQPQNPLLTLNGGNWSLNIADNKVVPMQGFPPITSSTINIASARLWSPAFSQLRFNATFFVLETDGLLLANDTPRRFSMFGSVGISAPVPEHARTWTRQPPSKSLVASAEHAAQAELALAAKLSARKERKTKNPAAELGRSKSQREQNMAKVDYSLACLQQDVASAHELAERYHSVLQITQQTMIDAGAELSEPDSEKPGEMGAQLFTSRALYAYAETRLARYIFDKLDTLMAAEKPDLAPFTQVQADLKNLDLSQMDVPGLDSVSIDVYERAVANAAETLSSLSAARDSDTIIDIILRSLNELADPALGTVSADTLLGLFMLSVLRTSADAAAVLERDLYFVSYFSFLASDRSNLQAGRLAYALMVVESVIIQLRMDHKRLSALSELNSHAWRAVDTGNTSAIDEVFAADPRALLSRRHGTSLLALALEQEQRQGNGDKAQSASSMLAYLVTTFPSVFTRKFVLRDRTIDGQTLLMLALHSSTATSTLLDIVGNSPEYFALRDVRGYTVAHKLCEPSISLVVDRVGHLLSWTQKDAETGLTPILSVASRGLLSYVLKYCDNFYDHLDPLNNSLLHFAVQHDNDVLLELLQIPSCDVNWPNKAGRTPLMVAVLESSIELLLQAGADVWYFDRGDTQHTSSPALRRSLGALNSSDVFIQNTSRPDERLLFKPASQLVGVRRYDDFQMVIAKLKSLYQNSWFPRLEWLYVNLMDSGIGHLFYGALVWDDGYRIGYWLRLLRHHETFRESPPVAEFLSVDNINGGTTDNEDEKLAVSGGNYTAKSSSLGHEELTSISSFCRFSIEQFNKLEAALREFGHGYLAMHELQEVTTAAVLHSRRQLHQLDSLLQYKCSSSLQLEQAASALPRETLVVIDQLVKSTQDLQYNLVRPIALVKELEDAKDQLVESRAKLQARAGVSGGPSWLHQRQESKRIAEIQELEDDVSTTRGRIGALEHSIRETHYALASELSSFNRFQENEILDQIRKNTQHRLQAARDELRRLAYGYAAYRGAQ